MAGLGEENADGRRLTCKRAGVDSTQTAASGDRSLRHHPDIHFHTLGGANQATADSQLVEQGKGHLCGEMSMYRMTSACDLVVERRKLRAFAMFQVSAFGPQRVQR